MTEEITTLHIAPAAPVKRGPGLRLALLGGILLWLANPLPAIWPLAWVAIAPLILSVTEARSLRQAMWRGYLFGWVFLGAVWHWVVVTINAYTQNNVGWPCWAGLTLILASFYGLWGGVAWLIHRRLSQIPGSGGIEIVTLACAWVVMEYARTLGTVTMPWAQLSYSQVKVLPVLQIAEFTGAYGISFVMLLVNGALAYWWRHRGQAGSTRYCQMAGIVTALVCLYGFVRLQQPETGRPLPVATIQNGADSVRSHMSDDDLRAAFTDMTAQAARSKPEPALYVWPESGAPGDAVHNDIVLSFLADLARRNHSAILTGSTLYERVSYTKNRKTAGIQGGENESNSEQAELAENASVLIDPEGHRPEYYIKRQLVPFGEFVPLRNIIPSPIIKSFGFSDRDDVAGKSAKVLAYTDTHYGNVRLGPFICYEAMFPQYAREMTYMGANLLVTQSNDSWFQSRACMEQHLASVVLRAVENRRQVARSTTTGLTCFIDSRGRVQDVLPLSKPGFLIREMQMQDGTTLYTRMGDWFVLVCFISGVGLMWKYREKTPGGSERD